MPKAGFGVRAKYIYRYGETGNWIFSPTKQYTLAQARNWSYVGQCIIEVYEIKCPLGAFRSVMCTLLNQQQRRFEERRLAAFRNGREIPAWREEWKDDQARRSGRAPGMGQDEAGAADV